MLAAALRRRVHSNLEPALIGLDGCAALTLEAAAISAAFKWPSRERKLLPPEVVFARPPSSPPEAACV